MTLKLASSLTGGAGGPGTVFFVQSDSPGIGKLIIDNFAKNPYVYKTSSTTKELDAMTQGNSISGHKYLPMKNIKNNNNTIV